MSHRLKRGKLRAVEVANGKDVMAKVEGKANGTIRCCISGDCCRLLFTPNQTTKDGKREFVAFVPEENGDAGFVADLDGGHIKFVVPKCFDTHMLLRVALCNTKVTVIVSQANGDFTLMKLIVPAEPAG